MWRRDLRASHLEQQRFFPDLPHQPAVFQPPVFQPPQLLPQLAGQLPGQLAAPPGAPARQPSSSSMVRPPPSATPSDPSICSDHDSGCVLDDYAWVPAEAPAYLVHCYMAALPERCVPLIGTPGEKYRTEQLKRQLPVQDCEARHCGLINETELNSFRGFTDKRRLKCLGRASIIQLTDSTLKELRELKKPRANGDHSTTAASCFGCKSSFRLGDIAVYAVQPGASSKASSQLTVPSSALNRGTMPTRYGALFHPSCFSCRRCNELLVDLIYFYHSKSSSSNNRDAPTGFYCGRHHAECLRPRCSACDRLIFGDECCEAEGNSWHVDHFTCNQCGIALADSKYIMRDGRPHCCNCFEQFFAQYCAACNLRIGLNQEQMSYKGIFWHASPNCFRCETCFCSLLNRSFFPKLGSLYCSPQCYSGNGAAVAEELRNKCQKFLESRNPLGSPTGPLSSPPAAANFPDSSKRTPGSVSTKTYGEVAATDKIDAETNPTGRQRSNSFSKAVDGPTPLSVVDLSALRDQQQQHQARLSPPLPPPPTLSPTSSQLQPLAQQLLDQQRYRDRSHSFGATSGHQVTTTAQVHGQQQHWTQLSFISPSVNDDSYCEPRPLGLACSRAVACQGYVNCPCSQCAGQKDHHSSMPSVATAMTSKQRDSYLTATAPKGYHNPGYCHHGASLVPVDVDYIRAAQNGQLPLTRSVGDVNAAGTSTMTRRKTSVFSRTSKSVRKKRVTFSSGHEVCSDAEKHRCRIS